MKFKQKSQTVFLDPLKDLEGYEKGTKVHLILSPSLYWVKKLSLPVKSVREAKNLLPSLFEDSLPSGHYSYYTYKQGDAFVAFAYEDKKILSLLQDKGVSAADLASVHFAQSEFENLEDVYEVNEQESLYVKDGVVLLLPSSWVKEQKPLDVQSVKLSKHTIRLQQFSHLVDKSTLYKIAAVLMLFVLLLVGEIFITSSKVAAINEAKDALFAKYKLQPTMFQNRSIESKYSTIYKVQKRLRERVADFLKLKLAASQKITTMEYKNRHLIVNISGVKKGQEKRMLLPLKKKNVKYKTSFHGENMRVEVSL